jgi:uncharacterized protein (TIGR04222 family)
MDILHNPLAEMYGVDFLLLYSVVIAITLGVCWLIVSVADTTKNLPLPLIPANPNAYEIAYLQGEERRVTNLVVFNLIQRGFLQVNKQNIEQSPNCSNIERLTPLEQEIFAWFSEPRIATEISWQLYHQVQPYCQGYEQILQERQLLYLPDWRRVVQQACLIGETIILFLGGYKFLAALTNGHHNVVFLVIMTLFAFIMLKVICYLPPRLSYLGQKYLQQLQDVFEQLKLKQKFKTGVPSFSSIHTHLSIDEYDLLVALFGVDELAETPYNSYSQLFINAISSFSSSSGGGCGGCSSGSSCGGGCGGCGGGD